MKEIKGTQGNYLTQSTDVGDERIFVKTIKGININSSDWREATQEEKDAFEKEQEEKRKKEIEDNLKVNTTELN